MELFTPGSDDDPTWFEKQLRSFTRSTVVVDALLQNSALNTTRHGSALKPRYPAKVQIHRRQLEKYLQQRKTAKRCVPK